MTGSILNDGELAVDEATEISSSNLETDGFGSDADDALLFDAANIAEANLIIRDGEPAVDNAAPGNLI